MKKILILLLAFLIVPFTTLTAEASSIVGPDVIYKDVNQVLTVSQILKMYTAPNKLVILEDNFTGNGMFLDNHLIKIGYEDLSLTKDIIVNVKNIGAVTAVSLKGDSYTIHLTKNADLSRSYLASVLDKVGAFVRTSVTQTFFPTDTYTSNRTSPGQYILEINLASPTGEESTYIININVTDHESLVPDEIGNGSLKLSDYIVYILIVVGLLFIGWFLFIKKGQKNAYNR